jgi:hypothetical protein
LWILGGRASSHWWHVRVTWRASGVKEPFDDVAALAMAHKRDVGARCKTVELMFKEGDCSVDRPPSRPTGKLAPIKEPDTGRKRKGLTARAAPSSPLGPKPPPLMERPPGPCTDPRPPCVRRVKPRVRPNPRDGNEGARPICFHAATIACVRPELLNVCECERKKRPPTLSDGGLKSRVRRRCHISGLA